MKQHRYPTVRVPLRVWVFLAVALISAACAAPPLTLKPQPASTVEAPQVWVLSGNASGETVQTAIAETLLAAIEDQRPVVSIGNLAQARTNNYNRLPLTTDNAFLVPDQIEISDEALIEGLIPHLIGRVGVSCVESGDQAFWIMDKAAVNDLLDELDPSSELWASVASCGMECEECGCIGPMGGSTCSAALIPLQPTIFPSDD